MDVTPAELADELEIVAQNYRRSDGSGLAGFVLNYIPYIGAMAGTIGGVVVALLVFDDCKPQAMGLYFLYFSSWAGKR